MAAAESTAPRIELVPPRRLADLLTQARVRQGLTIEDLVERSGGRFGHAALASAERGSTSFDDTELSALTELYGVQRSTLVPPRSRLVVDHREGILRVDQHVAEFGRHLSTREEVLGRYLTLVYSMRTADPGTRVPLRADDLEVLGRSLRAGTSSIEADLEALMERPNGIVIDTARQLRMRVLVPAAGVLVAFCGVGALLLVGGDVSAESGPTGEGDRAVNELVTAGSGVEPEIGTAVVQERLPDGSPGPVTVRP